MRPPTTDVGFLFCLNLNSRNRTLSIYHSLKKKKNTNMKLITGVIFIKPHIFQENFRTRFQMDKYAEEFLFSFLSCDNTLFP